MSTPVNLLNLLISFKCCFGTDSKISGEAVDTSICLTPVESFDDTSCSIFATLGSVVNDKSLAGI